MKTLGYLSYLSSVTGVILLVTALLLFDTYDWVTLLFSLPLVLICIGQFVFINKTQKIIHFKSFKNFDALNNYLANRNENNVTKEELQTFWKVIGWVSIATSLMFIVFFIRIFEIVPYYGSYFIGFLFFIAVISCICTIGYNILLINRKWIEPKE